MSNATPGPWDYFVGNANGRGLIRIEQQGTGVHIASMPRGEVSEANARLMTQSPDLRTALDELVMCLDAEAQGVAMQATKRDRIAAARAALSKASAP